MAGFSSKVIKKPLSLLKKIIYRPAVLPLDFEETCCKVKFGF
jgi:hypothetical protein